MKSKMLHVVLLSFLLIALLSGCGKEIEKDNQQNVEESEVSVDTTESSEVSVEDVHIEATQVDYVADGEAPPNPCVSLNVPTQITKIGDFYFIVDCYNNQVIYSYDIDCPISDWNLWTNDIKMGHTVASDGQVYLVDDTENNRVLVFERINNRFVNTQVFENIGTRPHYIVYDSEDKVFYGWSSMTGQIYVFEHEDLSSQMYISKIVTIHELDGIYVRSFTIEGDSVYFVSGESKIIELSKSKFEITNRFPVPDTMAGMVQIMPVRNGYYITISTDLAGNQDYATMIYTHSLSDLEKGDYTDIYSYFIGGGTPYYMGEIDGRYFLTEHRLKGHSIWSFDIDEDGMPTDVQAVY